MQTANTEVDKARLQALYDQALSGDEIGLELGVSKQWVAVLLTQYSIVRIKRSQRYFCYWVLPRKSEIVNLFLLLRDDAAVAEQLGLSIPGVTRMVNEAVPDPKVLRKKPRAKGQLYDDVDILDSLRQAESELGAPFPYQAFDKWRKDKVLADGRNMPGAYSAMRRFNGWRAALTAAGVPANPSGGPAPIWDWSDALDALVASWKDLDGPPTVSTYDVWSRGQESHPSAATIRKHFGSWDEILIACWPLVHGIQLPGYGSSVDSSNFKPTGEIGAPYIAMRENISIRDCDPFERDPQLLERALGVHRTIQNSLADVLTANGFKPLRPSSCDPLFDIAWRGRDGRLWIAEVKSTTATNLENQLRMGLAQVLKYGEMAIARGEEVSQVIVTELPVQDPIWISLLERLEIQAVTLEGIGQLFE